MTLYEINERYHNMLELLDDDSMPMDEILNAAIQVEEELTEKAQHVAAVIRNMDAEVKAFKAEEDRMAAHRRALESKMDGLKNYLQHELEQAGILKVRGLLTLTVSPSPASVTIDNKSALPAEYLVPQEPKIDKTRIKDALKKGQEVPGARLTVSNHLTIR